MTPAQEAFAEAERRIAAWQEGEPLDLAIADLEEIPESIGNAQKPPVPRLLLHTGERPWTAGNTQKPPVPQLLFHKGE